MNTTTRENLFIVVLLALGLAMRSFGAWVYEFAHTSDHGIICLMVKHMLEGKEFPVFFYGLPYMGSLEPALSAVLCFFFGQTGFWINMGTALIAFAFLPLVYLWGRGAAGKAAGLAALAFCVIGPPQYFQFESWADGGYAAIPLLTCAVLVAGLRMLGRDLEGRPPTHGQFAVLGLIAGLGWWQSPLLIPAFLVCGLLFLAVMRLRVFSLRLFAGAGGFVIGSLPLWIWNVRNHWQTFDMVKTHDRPELLEGLRLFYVNRMASLMEYHRGSDLFRFAMYGLLIALTLLALGRLIAACRKNRKTEALYLAAAFLYIGVYSVLFAQSRFARVDAVRYVLILIPVLAVLFGAATAWLTDRFRVLGWVPVVALIVLQAKELPRRPPERERAAAFMPKAMKLGEYLESKNIRHLYTDYQVRGANHGLNYLLGEKFVFSPVERERVRPYARAMEQAENPAVLNNYKGFSNFLKLTGAACESNVVEGLLVQYDVKPPSDAWRLLSIWHGYKQPVSPGEWVMTWYSETNVICGFRLVCEADRYPSSIKVEVRDEKNESFITVLPYVPVTSYFWSGNRFYWDGSAYRFECRFPAVKTAIVRIGMKSRQEGGPAVKALLTMTPDADQKLPGDSDFSRLAEWIKTNHINRVYSDRWEANKLLPLTDPDVKLSLPPHVYDRAVLSSDMELDKRTAVIRRVREEKADEEFESIWAERHVPSQETLLGPWRIFTFPDSLHPHEMTPCLEWTGIGVVPVNDRKWALLALKTLQAAKERHELAQWSGLASEANRAMPDHRPLAEMDAACEEAEGVGDVSEQERMEIRNLWVPDIPIHARFHGGIELLGVKIDTDGLFNRRVEMKYLWKMPKGKEDGLRVFVHFKRDGKVIFQDDHALPLELAEGLQPDDVVVETRTVTVPKDVSRGPVHVEIGLYNPGQGGGRVKFKAPGQSGKAIVLPEPLTIR